MRRPLAAGFLLCMISVLPAAAATCPGNVLLQDSFTTASKALDTSASPLSKITVQGGKATISILQAGKVRIEQYWGARFGDATACVTVGTVATEKAENQIGALIFWAVDYNSFYNFQLNAASGQFDVAQLLPTGQWATPVPWTASPAIAQGMGKTNTLRVQAKGNSATLFINDQQVGTFNGTPPAGGGQFGFYAQSDGTDTVEFTNFAVASTQSATPLPVSAACPGTVIFQDQFPTGDSFMNLPPATGTQVSVDGGKGQINLLQANLGQAVQYTGNQFGDANICASFNTLPADKSESQMAGIQFWASDYSNVYSFLVSPSNGQYQLAQKSAGNWALVVNSVPTPAILQGMGKTNSLRVQTKGNTAWLFINNQQVLSFTATAPPGGGMVGFYAQSDPSFTTKETWQISNVTVAVPQ